MSGQNGTTERPFTLADLNGEGLSVLTAGLLIDPEKVELGRRVVNQMDAENASPALTLQAVGMRARLARSRALLRASL